MDELKQLFEQLFIIVQQYGDSTYNTQKEVLKRILNDIEGDSTDIDIFSKIKCEYKQLFFPKSPLSEFYIWKDDFAERKQLNDLLENIKRRLWELLKQSNLRLAMLGVDLCLGIYNIRLSGYIY